MMVSCSGMDNVYKTWLTLRLSYLPGASSLPLDELWIEWNHEALHWSRKNDLPNVLVARTGQCDPVQHQPNIFMQYRCEHGHYFSSLLRKFRRVVFLEC